MNGVFITLTFDAAVPVGSNGQNAQAVNAETVHTEKLRLLKYFAFFFRPLLGFVIGFLCAEKQFFNGGGAPAFFF
jgi:hypothetical protein